MKYFDLHCDTATELFDRDETLKTSSCHISDKSISSFEKYAQVTAVFSKCNMTDDECYKRFFEVSESFKEKNFVDFSLTGSDLSEELQKKDRAYILSVEDARILGGKSERIEKLCSKGLKLVTPLWKGVTCIGGAFDTDTGLSKFGKEAICEFLNRGVIIDISHASRKSAEEIFDIAKKENKPVIASHSNSFTVFPHERNLTDKEALKVADSGGVIGISLAPEHLCASNAGISDVTAHIEHYISLLGEEYVCFGCDFDGIDKTPSGLDDQSCIHSLYSEMKAKGYTDKTLDKIFFENAYSFFTENL